MSPEVGRCFNWTWNALSTVSAVCFMVTNFTRSEHWHVKVSHNSRHFEILEYQIYHKENLNIWLRYLGEWDRMSNGPPFYFLECGTTQLRKSFTCIVESSGTYLMLLDEQAIRLEFISGHKSWLIGILAAAFLQAVQLRSQWH